MLENWDTKSVLIGLAIMLVSKILIPKFFGSSIPKVTKELKIANKEEDTLNSADFDFKTKPLTVYRPDKPVYKMTLGITKSEINEFLKMEPTYLQTLASKQHNPIVNENAQKAVNELYEFVVDYMHQRYPSYFVYQGKNEVVNKATNKTFLRYAKGQTPLDLLEILSSNLEEELYLLANDEVLASTTSEELEIPIKKQKSLERIFAQTQSLNFTQSLDYEIVDDKMVVKRSIITRLPKTGCLVVGVRVYEYTLNEEHLA